MNKNDTGVRYSRAQNTFWYAQVYVTRVAQYVFPTLYCYYNIATAIILARGHLSPRFPRCTRRGRIFANVQNVSIAAQVESDPNPTTFARGECAINVGSNPVIGTIGLLATPQFRVLHNIIWLAPDRFYTFT